MRPTVALALLFVLMAGCSESGPENLKEYYEWVNDPGRGLMKTREANGIRLTVKYLPPEYLANQYLQGESAPDAKTKDSVLASYRNSLCFLLTIDAADSSGDVMTRGIGSYEEFAQRAMKMNFEMERYLKLRAGRNEYRPALAVLENTYGMRPKRDLMIVFASDAGIRAADTLQLTFEDGIFDTGINHFTFLMKDLKAVPEIPL